MPSIEVQHKFSSEQTPTRVMLQAASCQWLGEQLSSNSLVILLDCRPYSEYARSHVRGAINIAIPNLMLRRLKKGGKLGSISSLLVSEDAKKKFAGRHCAKGIVMYDSCSTDLHVASSNSTMAFLIDKFSEDDRTTRIQILEGKTSLFLPLH